MAARHDLGTTELHAWASTTNSPHQLLDESAGFRTVAVTRVGPMSCMLTNGCNRVKTPHRPSPRRIGDRRPRPRRLPRPRLANAPTSARSRRSGSTRAARRAGGSRAADSGRAGAAGRTRPAFPPVEHAGNTHASEEEADRVAALIRELLDADAACVDRQGVRRRLTLGDVLVVPGAVGPGQSPLPRPCRRRSRRYRPPGAVGPGQSPLPRGWQRWRPRSGQHRADGRWRGSPMDGSVGGRSRGAWRSAVGVRSRR